MLGLYLHIPYCEGKCFYCDFYTRGGGTDVPEAYVDALLRELYHFAPCAPLRPDTLYFGGGTPSLLTPAQVARLIDAAAPVAQAEITLEANPGTLTAETLRGFRAAGVNRLSLGVQTADPQSLARLGRKHTVEDSRAALELARAAGFTNISGDLMLALPAYTSAELRKTVALLADGGCTHISTYLLKIEENTVFARRPPTDLPDEDAAAEFYLEAVDVLTQAGYAQYEISNFARPGYASKHNLIYWNCADYIGLGPAAHSSMQGKRFATPADTQRFLQAPAVYEPQGDVTREDFIMLRLRLNAGLSLAELAAHWGGGFTREQTAFWQTLCANGLATLQGDIAALTPRGMLVQNSILCHFI